MDTRVLQSIAARSVTDRKTALREWRLAREQEDTELERSELGNISSTVEAAMYRRKRAEHLGKLIAARQELEALLTTPDLPARALHFLETEVGEMAVRTALLALKNRHIGTSMLELNVCGAQTPSAQTGTRNDLRTRATAIN